MPKRTVIDARTGRKTVENFTLSPGELAAAQAYEAFKAREVSSRTALFSAAVALDLLPNPYNQVELNAKVEEILNYLRNKHPEDVR